MFTSMTIFIITYHSPVRPLLHRMLRLTEQLTLPLTLARTDIDG